MNDHTAAKQGAATLAALTRTEALLAAEVEAHAETRRLLDRERYEREMFAERLRNYGIGSTAKAMLDAAITRAETAERERDEARRDARETLAAGAACLDDEKAKTAAAIAERDRDYRAQLDAEREWASKLEAAEQRVGIANDHYKLLHDQHAQTQARLSLLVEAARKVLLYTGGLDETLVTLDGGPIEPGSGPIAALRSALTATSDGPATTPPHGVPRTAADWDGAQTEAHTIAAARREDGRFPEAEQWERVARAIAVVNPCARVATTPDGGGT